MLLGKGLGSYGSPAILGLLGSGCTQQRVPIASHVLEEGRIPQGGAFLSQQCGLAEWADSKVLPFLVLLITGGAVECIPCA